jgi:hypothetical protein
MIIYSHYLLILHNIFFISSVELLIILYLIIMDIFLRMTINNK